MNIKRYIDKRVKDEIKQLRRHIRRDSVNIPGVIREILALCKEFISVVGPLGVFATAAAIVGRIGQIVLVIGGVRNEIELARISKKLEKLQRELDYEMKSVLFSKNSTEKLAELDKKRAEAEKLIVKRAKLISERVDTLIALVIGELGVRLSVNAAMAL